MGKARECLSENLDKTPKGDQHLGVAQLYLT